MTTKKIAFIGAAGSGKTTLTAEVFVELKKKNINAELITEWIRYDIHSNGPMESIWEQYRTGSHQRKLEDSVPATVDYVLTDSGTLTPYFYSCLYANNMDSRQRLVLQDMHAYLLDDLFLKRYEFVFYLPVATTLKANENILKDGTRYQTQEEIEILDTHMSLVFTKLYNLDNIYTITGPLSERKDRVLEILLKTT